MGVDDVHANASSLSCFSCCFVFLCIGAKGRMGAFRIGFCGVVLKCPDSAVPTLGFSHMPAWTSMCMYCGFHVLFLFLLCASVGSGDGGDVDDVGVVLHDVDCLCGRYDTYGDYNDDDLVAACCPCCYVTFQMPPMQNTRVF